MLGDYMLSDDYPDLEPLSEEKLDELARDEFQRTMRKGQ
jgi:hypothetical protein